MDSQGPVALLSRALPDGPAVYLKRNRTLCLEKFIVDFNGSEMSIKKEILKVAFLRLFLRESDLEVLWFSRTALLHPH